MPIMEPAQPLEAVKINDSTYRIEDNGVRSLLFIGADRALLMDTGFGAAGSVREIVASLTDKPVTLILSHADPDHIGNYEEFDAASMHPSEMAYFFRNAKPGAAVCPVWDGDIIDLGGREIEIVLIPGHTPGSIALLDRGNRVIAAGDSVSGGPVFMFDNERSIYAYMASMEKLISLSGAYDEIYPSHGPFPLPPGQVVKALAAAKKLLAGELSPMEPPFPIPAKMYMHDGAGFFY